MVNNQNEFNKEYNNKETTEIKIKNEDFEGQLIVENYPSLEILYLRGIDSIDKIILKNLTQLQKCTISDCGVQELVIENCPQIKELNVSNNSLTNLEFLKNVEKLQKLDVDDNTTLESGLEHLPQSLKEFSCENIKLPYQKEQGEDQEKNELQQPSKVFNEGKKNLYGIIVAKKDKEGNLTKKFFKLEEEYKNEKELHRDIYPIM